VKPDKINDQLLNQNLYSRPGRGTYLINELLLLNHIELKKKD